MRPGILGQLAEPIRDVEIDRPRLTVRPGQIDDVIDASAVMYQRLPLLGPAGFMPLAEWEAEVARRLAAGKA